MWLKQLRDFLFGFQNSKKAESIPESTLQKCSYCKKEKVDQPFIYWEKEEGKVEVSCQPCHDLYRDISASIWRSIAGRKNDSWDNALIDEIMKRTKK